MLLSIIIVNWNTYGLLRQYLKNIESLDLNFEYEIIIVDNATQRERAENLKKEFTQIQLIANPKNQGVVYGNNQGIKQSKGKYLLISNSDISLSKGSLEKMIAFLEKPENSKIGLIGPKLLNPDHSRQDSCFRDIIRLKWYDHLIFPAFRRTGLKKYKYIQNKIDYFLFRDKKYDHPMLVDWVLGAFMLAKKEIFNPDQIGLFDESLANFLSESDLGRRIRDKNLEIWYYPETSVLHYPHRVSAGGLEKIFSRKTWCHISDWFKYFYKWRIKR